METRLAYCSACDREVRVMVNPELPEDEPLALADPADLVCLAFGESCTGAMCPLFQQPTEEMRRRFRETTEEEGAS